MTSFSRRGDKVIIWDAKGNYTQALADKPNVDLLAPWDERSFKWCIGKDISNIIDCQNMSYSIIPENKRDPQPYFQNASRDVLEAILVHLLAEDKNWGWNSIWQVISQGRKTLSFSLRQTDEGRKARVAIEAANRSSLDVYASLVTASREIKWLAKAWGNEGTSLKEWFNNEDSRALILGGIPERKKLASLTASLALQILVNEILSLPDDLDRRVWLILDEFGTLGLNENIVDAFTVGRSKGLCAVVGIQDIGEDRIYLWKKSF